MLLSAPSQPAHLRASFETAARSTSSARQAMSMVDWAGIAADDNKWRRRRAALDSSGQHHRRSYSWKKTERSLTVS
jgi:hypothetical protein